MCDTRGGIYRACFYFLLKQENNNCKTEVEKELNKLKSSKDNIVMDWVLESILDIRALGRKSHVTATALE